MLLNRSVYAVKMNYILWSNESSWGKEEKGKGQDNRRAINCYITKFQMSGLDFQWIVTTQWHYHPSSLRSAGVHKPGLPLRPALGTSNSPYHSLAGWLFNILEAVRAEIVRCNLKDTFKFVELIKERDTTGLTIASLELTSLLTNVPLLETINYLCQYITVREINAFHPGGWNKRSVVKMQSRRAVFCQHYALQADGQSRNDIALAIITRWCIRL